MVTRNKKKSKVQASQASIKPATEKMDLAQINDLNRRMDILDNSLKRIRTSIAEIKTQMQGLPITTAYLLSSKPSDLHSLSSPVHETTEQDENLADFNEDLDDIPFVDFELTIGGVSSVVQPDITVPEITVPAKPKLAS